jgi:nucleoid DNA-binding protein
MDLLSEGQRLLQKENLEHYAENYIDFAHISTGSFRDLMKKLARHGHVKVKGFGEFYIVEKQGGVRCRRHGKYAGEFKFASGRREVRFQMSTLLRDMVNMDWNNKDGIPMPNPTWWRGEETVWL